MTRFGGQAEDRKRGDPKIEPPSFDFLARWAGRHQRKAVRLVTSRPIRDEMRRRTPQILQPRRRRYQSGNRSARRPAGSPSRRG
jgi:hypothetical protein